MQLFVYNMKFFPTGGPPLATTKCVMATAVAAGGAAMGSAVATGGLPWVVSTGSFMFRLNADEALIKRFISTQCKNSCNS